MFDDDDYYPLENDYEGFSDSSDDDFDDENPPPPAETWLEEQLRKAKFEGNLWLASRLEEQMASEPPASEEGGSDNGASVAGSVGANVGGSDDDSPDPALPDPALPDPTPPAKKKEKKKARQSPVEPPPVEPPAASEEGTSDINGASVAGSDGGGVSDKDITNVLQGFQHRRVGYGYSHADVQAIAKKAILVERSKAVPPSAATSSSAPPSAATSSSVPKSGGTGKHAGTPKGMCDVCGKLHLSTAGIPRDQVQCWNKRNKAEHLGNPKLATTKDAFRKLAEANPDKYVPYKKLRVG